MKFAAMLESGGFIQFAEDDIYAVRLPEGEKGATLELYLSLEQAERLMSEIWQLETPISKYDIN